MSTYRVFLLLPVLLSPLLLLGCETQSSRSGDVQARQFTLAQLAKSDVDMVAEVSMRQGLSYLRNLAEKLYRRNPRELQRPGFSSSELEKRVSSLFGEQRPAGLGSVRAADAIALAFDHSFQGDRAAAFVVGLRDMQADAYGGEGGFYLHHEFDPQKLYHLARNLEIASWRLRQNRRQDGQLFLLSVGADQQGVFNTSFERLFGKMIGVHDQFAHVIADTTNRRIKNVVQGVASAVFFPI